MSDQPSWRLSTEEIVALKFAAHRQLARWAKRPGLSSHQQAQRSAFKHAVRVLQDNVFTRGCELHVPPPRNQENADV